MTAVRDAPMPTAVLAVLNAVMRVLLPTRAGRLIRPFALLAFRGRHTGRAFLVPAGLHRVADCDCVLTPAGWAVNFTGGIPVTVHYRGRTRTTTGRLDEDPTAGRRALLALLGSGTKPQLVGLKASQPVTPADLAGVDRFVIWLD
jgi:hypothetical protein